MNNVGHVAFDAHRTFVLLSNAVAMVLIAWTGVILCVVPAPRVAQWLKIEQETHFIPVFTILIRILGVGVHRAGVHFESA